MYLLIQNNLLKAMISSLFIYFSFRYLDKNDKIKEKVKKEDLLSEDDNIL
jgi:hypothetical protein